MSGRRKLAVRIRWVIVATCIPLLLAMLAFPPIDPATGERTPTALVGPLVMVSAGLFNLVFAPELAENAQEARQQSVLAGGRNRKTAASYRVVGGLLFTGGLLLLAYVLGSLLG